MLDGLTFAAQSTLPWVCTTALGLEVVPDVNMIPTGRSGSRLEFGDLGRVAVERGERFAAVVQLIRGRRFTRVVVGDDDPVELGARGGHHVCELRLGDGRLRARVLDEVPELGRHAAGVGRDRYASETRHGIPGNYRLGAVLGMDQDGVALPDSPGGQATGDLPGFGRELGIGPAAAVSVLGLPHQEGVVATVLGSVVDEPAHVLPVELEPRHGISVEADLVRHLRSRIALGRHLSTPEFDDPTKSSEDLTGRQIRCSASNSADTLHPALLDSPK